MRIKFPVEPSSPREEKIKKYKIMPVEIPTYKKGTRSVKAKATNTTKININIGGKKGKGKKRKRKGKPRHGPHSSLPSGGESGSRSYYNPPLQIQHIHQAPPSIESANTHIGAIENRMMERIALLQQPKQSLFPIQYNPLVGLEGKEKEKKEKENKGNIVFHIGNDDDEDKPKEVKNKPVPIVQEPAEGKDQGKGTKASCPICGKLIVKTNMDRHQKSLGCSQARRQK